MSSIRRTYYRGYLIRPKGDDFEVVTPCGELWTAIAVNRKTAKRWVDCDIAALLAAAERRAKRQLVVQNTGFDSFRKEGGEFLVCQ